LIVFEVNVKLTSTALPTSEPSKAIAANSTLEASSYGVNTHDTTTSTITMQAKDAKGNNLTTGGLTVTMYSKSYINRITHLRIIKACTDRYRLNLISAASNSSCVGTISIIAH
jgi:hypothetical protein